MAVLVNYYECYEAVKMVADIWMDALKHVPMPINDPASKVLFSLWVFRPNDIFMNVTREIIMYSEDRIGDSYALHHSRTESLETLASQLFNMREKITGQGCVAQPKSRKEEELMDSSRPCENDICVFYVMKKYHNVMHYLNIFLTQYMTASPPVDGPWYKGLSVCKLFWRCAHLAVSEGPEYLRGKRHKKCAFSYRVVKSIEGLRCR
ncbi:hypothetical protein BDV06DRAFT_225658 [Aspergillus oleicola]